MTTLLSLLAVAALSTTAAAAADIEFNPDRPGFSDSTGLVPPGALMTEVGSLLSLPVGAESTATLSAPGLLIRGGLTRHLELRVTAPDLLISLADGDAAGGSVGATGLGLKGAVGLGEVGLSVVGTLPVSTDTALETALGAPVLGVNVDGPAGETYGWAANAVLGLPEDGVAASWAGGLALGRAVAEDGGIYVQGAALGGGGEEGVQPLVGAGGTWMLLPTLQVDVYVDGLPSAGVNVGAGLACQW